MDVNGLEIVTEQLIINLSVCMTGFLADKNTLSIGIKYTYGTPTKFPGLVHLQQASPELPLHPLDGSCVFFYSISSVNL